MVFFVFVFFSTLKSMHLFQRCSRSIFGGVGNIIPRPMLGMDIVFDTIC